MSLQSSEIPAEQQGLFVGTYFMYVRPPLFFVYFRTYIKYVPTVVGNPGRKTGFVCRDILYVCPPASFFVGFRTYIKYVPTVGGNPGPGKFGRTAKRKSGQKLRLRVSARKICIISFLRTANGSRQKKQLACHCPVLRNATGANGEGHVIVVTHVFDFFYPVISRFCGILSEMIGNINIFIIVT